MNDKIKELLEAFLYGDATPDQERELLELTQHHPEVAEELRQQMVLSLKIRQLRERENVPLEVRNSLLRTINTMAAENTKKEERAQKRSAWLPKLRLGWSHAAVALGAVAIMYFFFLGSPETKIQPAAQEGIASNTFDTVTIVQTDTVREVQQVRVPVRGTQVAEVREEPAPSREAAPREMPQRTVEPQKAAEPDRTDALADADSRNSRADYQSTPASMKEEYRDMMLSTETVELTQDDRVRY